MLDMSYFIIVDSYVCTPEYRCLNSTICLPRHHVCDVCIIRAAKAKALISFAVTAKLICAFVFAYADCWFSHAAAQLFVTRVVSLL